MIRRLRFSRKGSVGMRTIAQPRLKIVLVFAMVPELTVMFQMPSSAPNCLSSSTARSTSTVLPKLNRMLTRPTRRGSGFAPMEQTMAVVTQSPR